MDGNNIETFWVNFVFDVCVWVHFFGARSPDEKQKATNEAHLPGVREEKTIERERERESDIVTAIWQFAIFNRYLKETSRWYFSFRLD